MGRFSLLGSKPVDLDSIDYLIAGQGHKCKFTDDRALSLPVSDKHTSVSYGSIRNVKDNPIGFESR